MKIGLIAMSGIRALDAELLRLGLTLPGFVERSRQIASLPSLGLLTLAGATPPGHELRYIEIADLNQARASGPLPDDFDLVAISSYSAQMSEAYDLADLYRARGVKVVLGGLHASAMPVEAARHADCVVVGEGEPAWPRLLADFQAHALQPLYRSAPGDFDMASAPLPAYELLDPEKYNRLTVQTSRGCPHRCEFCASSLLLTDRYRQKPADRVLTEIDRIRELWPKPFIEFADDNTFVDRAYWRTLLPRLAGRGVRWFTETDLSVAADGEFLTMMREAGCAQVLIGFESPTPGPLDGIEIKSNWKRRQFDRYLGAIDTIQSHGISVNGCFVVGLDGHGPDIFDRVFDFVAGSGLHEVQVTLPTPFPGTPFYARLAREGRLLKPEAWERCTLFDINFKPQGMTVEQLASGFRDLVVRLYGDDFTHRRRDRFKQTLRQHWLLDNADECGRSGLRTDSGN